MAHLDGQPCEWCDQPATESHALRGSKVLRVFACDAHSALAERTATQSKSASDGSLGDELAKQDREAA